MADDSGAPAAHTRSRPANPRDESETAVNADATKQQDVSSDRPERPKVTATLAAIAVAVGLAAVTAGCGGSSGTGVASVGANSPSTSTTSKASQQQDLLAFSKCMRSHGAGGFPDPQRNPDGSYSYGSLSEVRKLVRGSKQAFQACEPDLQAAGILAPQNIAKFRAEMLVFAQCMRSNGLPSFPDPTANGRFGGQLKNFDRNSGAFQNAMKVCRPKLTAARNDFSSGLGQ